MSGVASSLESSLAAVQPPAINWKQKIAAECYFRSPLPAMIQPVRERYRLSISSAAGRRRFSFRRRNEASARILYYHRVNDDNDPFFPAISTELFEQEMRFLRRRYTVVPLAELLERLTGETAKPVVAITFDDGYRDNFQNAFPILERYSLPATIFLTTGTIDDGEALWFETLALACKRTSREFHDLEIGSGERLWMRTEAERLRANERIFAILRTLPDAERRRCLALILRQLTTKDDGELKDRMLTWNQVRFMQSRGIDFGGHTVTHPFLSRMTSEGFLWEVSECKRRIEEEIQLPALHFAYPNGREEDFGAANKELIRKVGYRAAVTTIWGTNYGSTDPMELRRGGPWEPSAAQFAYKLDWYQLVND
ncbi:MAG: polysaccharide deacetylase family protein [Bryobacteraceae bacterium]